MDERFQFISGTSDLVHDLYHRTLESWQNQGKAVFRQEGAPITSDAQHVVESMCSSCIASVVLTHKQSVDAEALARFVYTAVVELTKQQKDEAGASTH